MEGNPPLNWPELAKPLFLEDGPGPTANLYRPAHTQLLISWGYKDAADFLIEDRPREADLIVYPVVFLYRHALELALKDLILQLGLTSKPVHSLESLWKRLAPALDEKFPDPNSEARAAVEARLLELHQVDRNGEAFRYAHFRDGQPTMQGLEYIDLGHLKRAMDEVFGYLGAAWDVIDVTRQKEKEWKQMDLELTGKD